MHVKLATGTYILKANRARFNQFAVSTMCPLCRDGSEDIRHFQAFPGRIRVCDPMVVTLHESNQKSCWCAL